MVFVSSAPRYGFDATVSKVYHILKRPLKCYVLKITKKKETVDFDYNINGQTLETVASNPYLGAELTNTMSWDKIYDMHSRCLFTNNTECIL
jgi:hypothetical protein